MFDLAALLAAVIAVVIAAAVTMMAYTRLRLSVEKKQPPEPVLWPSLWPLLVGVVPFLVLILLFELVNQYPWWSFGIGSGFLIFWLVPFGKWFARGLDSWFRTLDLVVHRTHGPDVAGYAPIARLWFLISRGGLLNGYSLPIFFWTAYATFVVVFGPTRTVLDDASLLWHQPLSTPVLVSVAILLLCIGGFAYFSWRCALHGFATLLLLAAVAGTAIWLWLRWNTGSADVNRWFPFFVNADETARGLAVNEADHYAYPHIFLVFVALAAILAYLPARPLARRLMDDFKRRYATKWGTPGMLEKVELFVRLPKDPTLRETWQTISDWDSFCGVAGHNLRSAIETPLRHPHLLLYPVAVAVLLVPEAYIQSAAVISTLFAWSVLAMAGNDERLNVLLKWLARSFFNGALWGVSLLVIALAACRFFGFSYIATIINSTSSLPLAWFIGSSYVILWYYKYWAGQALCERMLDVLRADTSAHAPVPYMIAEDYRETKPVKGTERYLQVHSTRFVVVGVFKIGAKHGQAWELYEAFDLFQTLAARQPDAPTDVQRLDAEYGLSDLHNRMRFYHAFLDVLVVAALAGFFALRTLASPVPELTANQEPAGAFDLDSEIFAKDKSRTVVLFAASGGGTRAALYGASVLRGLDQVDALDDVKLCSGVSGGSATIAYFAMHADELRMLDRGDRAPFWDHFGHAMSEPFIDDVLCGTLEFRVSCGTRMGTLLDESFRRRLAPPGEDGRKLAAKTLADATHFGIIFNTTLAGTQKMDDPPDPTRAGSRLVVTNLRTDDGTFSSKKDLHPGLESELLHYVVVSDPTCRLTTGAALSANFPPVFSNAEVLLTGGADGPVRQWVTDGGASENRGAISLLYALNRALEREAAKKESQRRSPCIIQIVIAEASGVSLDFSQDRGISSTLGASEKYANQLTQALLREIRKNFKDCGGQRLDVHFLPMPLALRSNRGGVGTHWKMPTYVTLDDPNFDGKSAKKTVILSDRQTIHLVMDLYVPADQRRLDDAKGHDRKQLDLAWQWTEGVGAAERYRQHRLNWDRLVRTFKEIADQRKHANPKSP
jgi:hypothetical protein